MITLFTTAKDFRGHNALNQLNAFHSWKASHCNPEIIYFGECEGIQKIIGDANVIHIPEVETSQSGVPLIGSMFALASERASHEICCFVNADIILPGSFFTDVLAIHKEERQCYLVVGQRLDVDVDRHIDFKDDWEREFSHQYGSNLKEHPPSGSDFFVFAKGSYQRTDFPALMVGRPGWDLWMIFDARKRGWRTIDLSMSTKVIHQNHDYSHKKITYRDEQEDPEAQVNLSCLPVKGRYMFTLLACDHLYRNGCFEKNYARGDRLYHLRLKRVLERRLSIYDRASLLYLKTKQYLDTRAFAR